MTEIRTTSSTGGEKGMKPERYDLLPVGPLAAVARLYGKGAEKYAAHNWRCGYEWSKSYAALMRHLTQFWNGEDVDEETGQPHMAAVVFHAFALLEFMERFPGFDDRFVASTVPLAEMAHEEVEVRIVGPGEERSAVGSDVLVEWQDPEPITQAALDAILEPYVTDREALHRAFNRDTPR